MILKVPSNPNHSMIPSTGEEKFLSYPGGSSVTSLQNVSGERQSSACGTGSCCLLCCWGPCSLCPCAKGDDTSLPHLFPAPVPAVVPRGLDAPSVTAALLDQAWACSADVGKFQRALGSLPLVFFCSYFVPEDFSAPLELPQQHFGLVDGTYLPLNSLPCTHSSSDDTDSS